MVSDKGTLQNIHVIVCTYAEDAATVEKCVVHLLEATLPVYATRTIWVADDGHMKASGPGKRASCEKLASAGVVTRGALSSTIPLAASETVFVVAGAAVITSTL